MGCPAACSSLANILSNAARPALSAASVPQTNRAPAWFPGQVPPPAAQDGGAVFEWQIVVAGAEGRGLENVLDGIEFGENGHAIDPLPRRRELVVRAAARIDKAVSDELARVVEDEDQLVQYWLKRVATTSSYDTSPVPQRTRLPAGLCGMPQLR